MSSIIKLDNLSYKVKDGKNDRSIINNINYTFETSKINLITGPSGSGKTTLLYALGGLLNSVEGDIHIDKTKLYSLTEKDRDKFRKENISMIFQNLNLFSFLNVEDNILMPYYIKRKDIGSKVRTRLKDYLEKFELGDIRDKSITSLSGGEQQRVAIIRSVIDNPKIILCDEPTASLDKKNTDRFMSMLTDIVKEIDSTVIISTHDEQVCRYGGNRLHLVDGMIVDEIATSFSENRD